MAYSISQSRLFFQDETPRPLGRLTLAGEIRGSTGLDPKNPRVLGRYALVCLAEGTGNYRDIRGVKTKVVAGQAILVFPEIAHSYGPVARGDWNEMYVCFEGPVFDLWRHDGLFPSAHPVFDLATPQAFADLRNLLSQPRSLTTKAHLTQLHQFLAILGDLIPLPDALHPPDNWLARAQAVFEFQPGKDGDSAGCGARRRAELRNVSQEFRARGWHSPFAVP